MVTVAWSSDLVPLILNFRVDKTHVTKMFIVSRVCLVALNFRPDFTMDLKGLYITMHQNVQKKQQQGLDCHLKSIITEKRTGYLLKYPMHDSRSKSKWSGDK